MCGGGESELEIPATGRTKACGFRVTSAPLMTQLLYQQLQFQTQRLADKTMTKALRPLYSTFVNLADRHTDTDTDTDTHRQTEG